MLASGFPVIVGMLIFEKAMAATEKGIMPMPKKNDDCLGGHAVLLVGYDDLKKSFLVRNSWGKEWGIDGHFWMPYSFADKADNVWDCWAVKDLIK